MLTTCALDRSWPATQLEHLDACQYRYGRTRELSFRGLRQRLRTHRRHKCFSPPDSEPIGSHLAETGWMGGRGFGQMMRLATRLDWHATLPALDPLSLHAERQSRLSVLQNVAHPCGNVESPLKAVTCSQAWVPKYEPLNILNRLKGGVTAFSRNVADQAFKVSQCTDVLFRPRQVRFRCLDLLRGCFWACIGQSNACTWPFFQFRGWQTCRHGSRSVSTWPSQPDLKKDRVRRLFGLDISPAASLYDGDFVNRVCRLPKTSS